MAYMNKMAAKQSNELKMKKLMAALNNEENNLTNWRKPAMKEMK